MALTLGRGANALYLGVRDAVINSEIGNIFWRAGCECEAKKRLDLGEDWGERGVSGREDKHEYEKFTVAPWPC